MKPYVRNTISDGGSRGSLSTTRISSLSCIAAPLSGYSAETSEDRMCRTLLASLIILCFLPTIGRAGEALQGVGAIRCDMLLESDRGLFSNLLLSWFQGYVSAINVGLTPQNIYHDFSGFSPDA